MFAVCLHTLQNEKEMCATPVLVLLTLTALIHWSSAITCYVCRSKSEPGCDDPFNRNGTGVHTLTCPSNACLKAKGRAKGKQISGHFCIAI